MEETSILDLSLFPGIKFPSRQISRVNGLSVGIFNATAEVYGGQVGVYNSGASVRGIQAGVINKIRGSMSPSLFGIANSDQNSLYGLQAGLLMNEVGGAFYGFQLSIAANFAEEYAKSYGVQAALLNSAGHIYGVQAGLISFSGHHSGIQFGVLGNLTTNLYGLQAGLINYVGNLKTPNSKCYGIQIGLVNVCSGTLKGVQIGLYNWAERALLPWSIGVNAGF